MKQHNHCMYFVLYFKMKCLPVSLLATNKVSSRMKESSLARIHFMQYNTDWRLRNPFIYINLIPCTILNAANLFSDSSGMLCRQCGRLSLSLTKVLYEDLRLHRMEHHWIHTVEASYSHSQSERSVDRYLCPIRLQSWPHCLGKRTSQGSNPSPFFQSA